MFPFGSHLKILREPVKDFILSTIKKDKIVIFSKTYCPYCRKAKSLFDSHKLEFKAVELDEIKNGGEIQNILKEITKQSTVPNIFIKGQHIGGSDKLAKSFDRGIVQDLLKE